MVDKSFGGTATNSFTEGYAWTEFSLQSSRAASNGGVYGCITALYGYVSGNGATRTLYMQLGSANTSTFSRASDGTPGGTGYIGTDYWVYGNGGTGRFGYYGMSGSCRFLRATSGGFSQGAFGTWPGDIGGAYRYARVPAGPTIASIVPNGDGDATTVTLGAAPDSGGFGITGYRVQRATNPTFTTDLATVDAPSGVAIMTGLVPGVTYYYRATARNYITDVLSILGGSWSATETYTQPDPTGLGRRYNGVTFASADARRYNLSLGNWEQADGLRYDAANTEWAEIGI